LIILIYKPYNTRTKTKTVNYNKLIFIFNDE